MSMRNNGQRTGPDVAGWQRVAEVALRRIPGLAHILRVAMGAIQPRFSIGAVGVLFDADGRTVFLVEHLFHPNYPWGLPGGWLDAGENPAQTVEREFHEETSLTVRAVQPLLVQQSPLYRRHMDVVYLCELHGDATPTRLSRELLDCAWVPLDALPDLAPFHTAGIQAGVRLLAERDSAPARRAEPDARE